MPRGVGALVTLVVAAVLVCVPAAALVAERLLWADAPARVPTHWDAAGAADGHLSSTGNFWLSLLPSAGCALVAIMVLVFVGTSVRPIASAITFGALAAIAALFSIQWLVDALTARHALQGGDDGMGSPFLLYLLGLVWGMLVFGIVLLGRLAARHDGGPGGGGAAATDDTGGTDGTGSTGGTEGTGGTDPADTMTT